MPTQDNQQEKYTVAILGATGLVGGQLMQILEERNFPVKRLKPLASKRSAGGFIRFRDENITVEEATPEAFEGVDIVLASAGGDVSLQLAHEAVKRGAVVVDNTSAFRMNPDVPLVVAGVNDEDVKQHNGIIANPNCSTAQLMPVLQILADAAGLKRVIISTYQSVSGAGKEGIDEMLQLSREFLAKVDGAPTSEMTKNTVFQRPIGFNLIPHIDSFIDDGPHQDYTKEEAKLIDETRKILHLPNLPITATAVRVPVMVGHSESVTVDLEKPLSPEDASRLLAASPMLVVSPSREQYPTPIEATGKDPVYVGRIRRDSSNPETGLNLWVVADNLRIGAALNAVRIAELLVKHQCLRPALASGSL